jgi:stage II sporulation protein D
LRSLILHPSLADWIRNFFPTGVSLYPGGTPRFVIRSTMSKTLRILSLALLALLLAAVPAGAAARLTIRGAGFGHGVGMSQYGALGLAQHGRSYDAILAHYYTGTELGAADENHRVRVLLQSTSTVRFSGAVGAGNRNLSPEKSYAARARGGGKVDLLTARGRRIATFSGPLQVAGGDGGLLLGGRAGNGRSDGRYRGILELRPGVLGGLDVVNDVGLEDYVRGVVAWESPSSWPQEALKAQAVAARTYAITTRRSGAFDQYPDTRSQMYGGIAAEIASTDRAVADTAGQVVTYEGEPVVTFFFSTSGGRTEDVENTSLGTAPRPWLKSVEDPYDDVSPRHVWKPVRMSLARAASRLGGLVKGSLRGIRVVERGRSPRIVAADVIGSRGRTRVTGATLRARLGLYDTWAYFTTIGVRKAPPPQPPAEPGPEGGTGGAVTSRRRAIATLAGEVVPAHRGAEIQVQLRRAGGWTTVGSAHVGAGGRYRVPVSRPGTYRVVYWGDAGPSIRVG